jgi:hypothetical protein
VIKERHTGVDLGFAGAIHQQFDLDVCLSRFAVLFRDAGSLHEAALNNTQRIGQSGVQDQSMQQPGDRQRIRPG